MDDNAKVCQSCGTAVVKVQGDLGLGGNVVTIGGEQPQEAPAASAADVEKKVKIFGIVGIACGVVGLLLSLITLFLAFPVMVAGIVCSILGLKAAKEAGIDNKLCIFGLIASISGPIIGFVISFVIGVIIGILSSLLA